MKSSIDQILDLKTAAKNQRDRGVRGYPRALAGLKTAIDLAHEGLAATSVGDVILALTKELADCLGMVGGVERRWGIEGDEADRMSHLSLSCAAYDEGYGYEWDPAFGTPATYNLVNRLTGRLLIRPDLLELDEVVDLGNAIAPINVRRDLIEAITLIDNQVAKKGNFWAEADLALLLVLTGQPVSTAYAPFFALSPPGYAYGSALDGLRLLATSTVSTAPLLQEAIAELTSKRLTS